MCSGSRSRSASQLVLLLLKSLLLQMALALAQRLMQGGPDPAMPRLSFDSDLVVELEPGGLNETDLLGIERPAPNLEKFFRGILEDPDALPARWPYSTDELAPPATGVDEEAAAAVAAESGAGDGMRRGDGACAAVRWRRLGHRRRRAGRQGCWGRTGARARTSKQLVCSAR